MELKMKDTKIENERLKLQVSLLAAELRKNGIVAIPSSP